LILFKYGDVIDFIGGKRKHLAAPHIFTNHFCRFMRLTGRTTENKAKMKDVRFHSQGHGISFHETAKLLQ